MGRAKNERMLGPEASDTTKDAAKIKTAGVMWNLGQHDLAQQNIVTIPKALMEGKAIARKDLRGIQMEGDPEAHLAASSPQYKKLSPAEKAKVDKMVVKMRNARRK